MTSSGDRPDGTISWRELLAETVLALSEVESIEAPEQEARWIVEEASGLSGGQWVLGLEELATVRGVAHLDSMIQRRVNAEPIQYVLGHWSFRKLDLLVDQRVLIPRPETEQVVEVAFRELDRLIELGPHRQVPTVVDLGTGSGAIGLSFVVERPKSRVWITDASQSALSVARANLSALGMAAGGVRVGAGSWFEALPSELQGGIDLLISNPPYIGEDEQLAASVREWEPTKALISGPTGLECYEVILAQAPQWLNEGGSIVLELGASQGRALVEMAQGAGFEDVRLEQDLAGLDRVLVANLSPLSPERRD